MAQTPSTWADYVGNGVENTFQVTFPYQKQQEVFVTVDGAPAAFTFISAGWVQLAVAPANGAAIRVQRSTEAFEPRHEFANGVPLLPRFIDENNKQFLYVVQEAVNETTGTAAAALALAERTAELVGDTGLVSLGNYAPGLNFTLYNQYMARDGFFYRPAPSSIPFTTTGAWVGADENLFILFSQDDVLRQDLAKNTDPLLGAGMVGRSGQVVGSIADLRLLDKTAASRHAFVTGYYEQGDGGGGTYYLDTADILSADNGGTIIVSADGGRWKLANTAFGVSAKQFGAKGDGTTDDTAALQRFANYFGTGGTLAAASGGKGFIPKGVYPISAQILWPNIGVAIHGESAQATIIKVTANITGAAFKFAQSLAGFSDVAISLSDIVIDMAGFNGHGLWMLKPYDTSSVTNVFVKNVGDIYNGVRVEPDPANPGDPVSQSVVFTGCEAAHKNTTATAEVWYLDSLQECQFIGCKGFSNYSSSLSASVPWHFKNCRGIVLLGCTSMSTSGNGIYIDTSTRDSGGIQIIGHTYESCANMMFAAASGGFKVYQIYHVGMRQEGSGGGFTLRGVTNSHIDCGVFGVTLDAACQYNTITVGNGAVTSNDGIGNTIIRNASSGVNKYEIRADGLLINRKDGTSSVELSSGSVDLSSAGALTLSASYPYAAANAGMLVLVNRDGVVTMSQVSVGGVDSGGAGFRLLRVLN
jgi:hypothetical protein